MVEKNTCDQDIAILESSDISNCYEQSCYVRRNRWCTWCIPDRAGYTSNTRMHAHEYIPHVYGTANIIRSQDVSNRDHECV